MAEAWMGSHIKGAPIAVNKRKSTYVRNCFTGSARSDVTRRAPEVAAQPQLGLLLERRTGLDPGHCGCPAFAGQNLSGRDAVLQTPWGLGSSCRVSQSAPSRQSSVILTGSWDGRHQPRMESPRKSTKDARHLGFCAFCAFSRLFGLCPILLTPVWLPRRGPGGFKPRAKVTASAVVRALRPGWRRGRRRR